MSQFIWHRDVPAEWQQQLDQFNPGENVTSLHLSWIAGQPYQPVQRWVIYEVTPLSTVTKILEQERVQGIKHSMIAGVWKDLNGEDPRTAGKWRPDKRVPGGQRWISHSMVSRNQWDLHKQTGGLPVLCWIIEGEQGGHSWQFGPFEQSFLLSAGVSPELIQEMVAAWPNPGALPYADFDNRVLTALAERDLLGKYRQGKPWTDRTDRTEAGIILQGESTSRREEMNARMMKWLDNQIGEAVSDVPRKMLPQWSDYTRDDSPRDEAELETYLIRE